MMRFRLKLGASTRRIAPRAGTWVAAFLCATLWATSARAFPSYDDAPGPAAGHGCVQCHNQFQGGSGVLHQQHRSRFGVTTCNVCHPSGGGTTPVLTYWSGGGGGFGCAGCHGRDYGETSPNSGQPKATAYGLRQLHVNEGWDVCTPPDCTCPDLMGCDTSCGTSNCHQPGTQGHQDPFPPVYPEDVAPPYYDPAFSNLTNPCDSSQEDLPFDMDSVGLDNDGDGFADYPDDSDCAAPPSPTPTNTPVLDTPTPDLGIDCGTAPAVCIEPAKGKLIVNEKTQGKEKLKVALSKLQPAVTQGQFGDPVGGSTGYKICIYDGADQLRGNYTVARAGATCGDEPCWSAISTKGYKYRDQSTTSDGILKMKLLGGPAGKGKVKVIGKNKNNAMPLGVAGALAGQTSATVQVLTSDASCFGMKLTQVKKADGLIFSAKGP